MTVTHRSATSADAHVLAEIINDIIEGGGTTAHQSTFDTARMLRHYIFPEGLISCTVAELDGTVVGFQSLVWPDKEGQPFPIGWAIIASFVKQSAEGHGIGRSLFAQTKAAAIESNVATIDATIRADNLGGLAYYDSLGFSDYEVLRSIPLRDGRKVDRIRKRKDL